MPSGAKKRRAARRKQQEKAQTKQTDDFTTDSIVKLTIPIEELAKGDILHEAASVDKELEQSNLSIGEVADVTKVATVDDNTVEENEIPLLNFISNDVSAVSQNAGCVIKTTDPGVSNDSKETEILKDEPEEIVENVDDLLSIFAMSPEEMWEKYHDYYENRDFFFRELGLPVVIAQQTSNEDVKEITPNSAENTVFSSAETTSESKETQAVSITAVSPATENQAHFSCPLPCNPECTAMKESIVNLMARVVDFESSIHTFKEDLQKTLNKLNDNSF